MSFHLKSFVRNILAYVIRSFPPFRRIVWRTGRSLYCLARGEQQVDDMNIDGELALQRRVVAACRPQARFVGFDVGANQGDWTLALIEAFESVDGSTDRLEAHVFEPVPTTRERLEKRLQEDRGANVHINSLAASDKTGTFEMIVMSDTGGTNSLVYDATMARQALGFVSVTVTTIDLYCEDAKIDHINIVKCDTEGNDLSVIRGAAGMLRAGKIDIFQFEYNHRWIGSRSFLKDVFELISDMPYIIGRVLPNKIETYEYWNPEIERYYQSNYVLILKKFLPLVKTTSGKFDRYNTYS